MILVGSRAARFHNIDLGRKTLEDEFDLIVPGARFPTLLKFLEPVAQLLPLDSSHAAVVGPPVPGVKTSVLDLELAWKGSSGETLLDIAQRDNWQIVWFSTWNGQGLEAYLPPVEVLLALKMSHRYKKNSPHFAKTMQDVHTLREETRIAHYEGGAPLNLWLSSWLKQRELETYDYAHPKLNRNKEDFFKGDQVPYKYDHDSLHLAVCHPAAPAYKLFAIEGQEVLSSRALFETLDVADRCRAVLEESYVLALERSQIPFDFKVSRKISFDIALEKVCTSITSGWFREFAWEHYYQVQEMYDAEYVDRFWAGLERGTVKPYTGVKY